MTNICIARHKHRHNVFHDSLSIQSKLEHKCNALIRNSFVLFLPYINIEKFVSIEIKAQIQINFLKDNRLCTTDLCLAAIYLFYNKKLYRLSHHYPLYSNHVAKLPTQYTLTPNMPLISAPL